MRRFIVGCIGLLLSIAAACAWSQDATSRMKSDATVSRPPVLPDLRGKTCEQAQAELRALHLSLTECRSATTRSAYPAGTINAQSVAPGTPVSLVDGLRVTYEPARTPDKAPAPAPVPGAATDATKSSAGAAAAAAAAAAMAAIIAQSKSAVLPDLRGMTCDQARAALRPLRIALAECLPGEGRATVPAGTINAQSHAPGTPASRVDRLRVWLEPLPAQPRLRMLPDLRGKTCAEAAEALAALDLRYASCEVGAAIDSARPGRVNGQSPNAGTVLPLAAPIVLRVQPAPLVVVPALIGLGEAQAVRALAGRRLQARASGPAASKGRRVLTQRPDAGASVAPGSVVAFGLGLSIPRLLGLDCATARVRAAEYGHGQIECESRPATSPGETVGRVFEQMPEAGGAPVPAPAAIRVVFWAAQPVTVPDVRELSLDEATRTIEAASLVAQPDDREGERFVARQSPVPGTVVEAGSAVQLSTLRLATVPDLGALTCADAAAALAPDTFVLRCEEEQGWRVTVFGAPQIVAQQPAARARAAVGATILAEARAPLPPSAQWLGAVPFAAVAGVVVAPLLGLGLWLAWPRPVPPPAAPRVVLPLVPPVVPPPKAPRFEWRLAADSAPSVSLRWSPARKAAGRGPGPAGAERTWRVVPDTGHVLLREFAVSSGGDHADR